MKTKLVLLCTLLSLTGWAQTYQVGKLSISLEGTDENFSRTARVTTINPGIEELEIILTGKQKAMPKPIAIKFKQPSLDIQSFLGPYGADATGRVTSIYNFEISRMIPVNFLNRSLFTSAMMDQPSISFVNNNNRNRLTLAASELIFPVTFRLGENEDGGVGFELAVGLFEYPTKALDTYRVSIRFDSRDIHYNQAQRELLEYWKKAHGLKMATVPLSAHQPVYSTWYALKADGVNAANVELQAGLAKKLGCETIIVDDGWQKAQNAKAGYCLYNGDWEVDPQRFQDFKSHVKKVQALGMNYMMWVGPSMVGEKSKVYEQLKDKMLYKADWAQAWVVDPRFPEVRSYLVNRLVTLMRESGIDGYKIDFMDLMNSRYVNQEMAYGMGRDFESVEEASVKLLADIYQACQALNPNVMIEFRQYYTNPVLQQYANMFRAMDCPNDLMENRTRTLDARNLNYQVIHADPQVWHEQEKPEHAAMQILHTMLSVPQVSTDLTRMDATHLKMLSFVLGQWRDYHQVLTRGQAFNYGPESLYTWSETSMDDKTVIVAYQPVVMSPQNLHKNSLIINGTHQDMLVFDFGKNWGKRSIEVYSCTGELIRKEKGDFKGLYKLNVPPAGLVRIQ